MQVPSFHILHSSIVNLTAFELSDSRLAARATAFDGHWAHRGLEARTRPCQRRRRQRRLHSTGEEHAAVLGQARGRGSSRHPKRLTCGLCRDGWRLTLRRRPTRGLPVVLGTLPVRHECRVAGFEERWPHVRFLSLRDFSTAASQRASQSYFLAKNAHSFSIDSASNILENR